MKSLSKGQLLSLFLAGIFAGEAADHIIYAFTKSGAIRFELSLAMRGNLFIALVYSVLTFILLRFSLKKKKL
jgi:hypothetical protein